MYGNGINKESDRKQKQKKNCIFQANVTYYTQCFNAVRLNLTMYRPICIHILLCNVFAVIVP